MIAALELLAYAAALIGASVALRGRWTSRAPRLAVAAWQAISVGIVTALFFAAAAIASPMPTLSAGIAGWFHACSMAIRHLYATPSAGDIAPAVGLFLAAALLARVVSCLVMEFISASRRRRRHLDALALLGRRDARLGATILDSKTPAAYCLPGKSGRVVLTSGTLAALEPEQLVAVLAHERAHLRGRHHLALSFARALARALPLPVLTSAHEATAELLEMLADDAAAVGQRRTLASALTTLATAPAAAVPAGSMAAGALAVTARVSRLLAPRRRLPAATSAVSMAMLLILGAAPVAIAALPAVAAASQSYCPITST